MFSSCAFLGGLKEFNKATAPYWETDNEDGVLGYYYQIYVENKTDETIKVFYRDGRKIGNIKKGKIKNFNVEKRSSIYIIGKDSQRQYLTIVCNWDKMEIIVN
jgi:hypothetical protein